MTGGLGWPFRADPMMTIDRSHVAPLTASAAPSADPCSRPLQACAQQHRSDSKEGQRCASRLNHAAPSASEAPTHPLWGRCLHALERAAMRRILLQMRQARARCDSMYSPRHLGRPSGPPADSPSERAASLAACPPAQDRPTSHFTKHGALRRTPRGAAFSLPLPSELNHPNSPLVDRRVASTGCGCGLSASTWRGASPGALPALAPQPSPVPAPPPTRRPGLQQRLRGTHPRSPPPPRLWQAAPGVQRNREEPRRARRTSPSHRFAPRRRTAARWSSWGTQEQVTAHHNHSAASSRTTDASSAAQNATARSGQGVRRHRNTPRSRCCVMRCHLPPSACVHLWRRVPTVNCRALHSAP